MVYLIFPLPYHLSDAGTFDTTLVVVYLKKLSKDLTSFNYTGGTYRVTSFDVHLYPDLPHVYPRLEVVLFLCLWD